jgi:hypothetical protein
MSLISALFGIYLHQAYVKVPDGYQIDLEREPPAYAIPRDRSNIAKLEIPTGHLLGDGKLVLRYDSEMRSIAPSGEAVILRMQWAFD